jgi:hypothetical protein
MAKRTRTARDFANYRLSSEVEGLSYALMQHVKGGDPASFEQLRQQYALNKQHPRPPIQRTKKFKLLDNYDKGEADALQHLVLNKKRDIRLIRDAQTKQGAEEYIARRNLQDHLYVTDNDVDGDGINDIIVRQKQTELPIIIDGYKTEKSRFPLRQAYYTEYPTREARKGKSINDYTAQQLDPVYDSPTHRKFNEEKARLAQYWASKGYAKVVPKENINIPTAFKLHFYKPIMKSLKEVLKANNIPLSLSPQDARDLESAIRAQLITIPAMRKAYTDAIMNVSDEEWNWFQGRKGYKEKASEILLRMFDYKEDNTITILSLIIIKLVELGAVQDIDTPRADQIVEAALLNMPKLSGSIDN